MNIRALRVKLADPNIGPEEQEMVREVLLSGQLVKGPHGLALEAGLAEVTHRRFAVAVSSGSMALLAAMKAMGIGPSDTVMVPALTFPAPAFIASFLGAKVRLADVDRDTLNLSVDTMNNAFDESVSLVVAIDQFGVPAPTPALEQALASRGVPVLVDAACSIGASLAGAPAGSFGAASTLSFHPRKVITSGEGGAVLTDDETLAREVRRWVDQGVEGGTFVSTGLNLRLGEMNCAIGRAQLARLDAIVARRQQLAERYRELPLRFQSAGDEAVANHQTLVAVLPSEARPADRTALIAHLREQGIEATIASYCLSEVPGIRAALHLENADMPVSREVHDLGMALPLHPGLTDGDVDEVVRVMHNWLKQRGWA